MDNWESIVHPRAGGWNRLNAKLNAADEDRRGEIRLWGMVATVMTIVMMVVATQDFPFGSRLVFQPQAATVLVDDGQAAEVPGTPPGIHYYWIFR